MVDIMIHSKYAFNFFPTKINNIDNETIYQNNDLFTYKNRNILFFYQNVTISLVSFILGILISLKFFQNNLKLTFNSIFNIILQISIVMLVYCIISIAIRIDREKLNSSSTILSFTKHLDEVIAITTLFFLSMNIYFPGFGSLGFFLISIHLVIKEIAKNNFQKQFVIRKTNENVICEFIEYYPHPFAFIKANWMINLNEIKQLQFVLDVYTLEKKYFIFKTIKNEPISYDEYQELTTRMNKDEKFNHYKFYVLKIVGYDNSKQKPKLLEVMGTKNPIQIKNMIVELSNHTIPFEFLLNTF